MDACTVKQLGNLGLISCQRLLSIITAMPCLAIPGRCIDSTLKKMGLMSQSRTTGPETCWK